MKSLILVMTVLALFALAVLFWQPIKQAAVGVAEKAHACVTSFMAHHGLMLMAITSTAYPAQSHSRMYNYRHLDDAATPAAISVNPGFRPRYVCVENITDRIKYEWYEGMAATDYLKTVAAGTRSLGTDSKLAVVVAAGSQPSVTLAASETLQNKQYEVHARS